MSCNQPYFRSLLSVVKDTWAKPLMQNKYPNIIWFAYTSCDKHHPEPVIDYENHMIYVKCEDDLSHTYEKTKLAYQMIVNSGIDFDYVVRTNTSVFVNLKKMIERIDTLPKNKVMCKLCKINFEEPYRFLMIMIGYFFGMDRSLFDTTMYVNDDYIKNNCLNSNDDVVISTVLFEKFNLLNICHTINEDDAFVPMYKPHLPEDVNNKKLKELPKKDITFDSNCVNESVVCRVRSFYDNDDRIKYGHELEHFYELYDALEI